ncbi:MAG: potassium channel family protein [Actinomycetota bacterium]
MNSSPTRVEAWLERRFPPYRYGAVFVLLVITYVVVSASPPDISTRVVAVVLEGVTLLVTLVASRVGRLLFRIAVFAVVGAIVAVVVSLLWGSSSTISGWFFAVDVLLVAAAPVAIAHALYRRPVIDIRTVLGAICIYLLIGIMFAFVYATIAALGPGAFFVQTDDPGIQTFLYFSFVTQTTVGYGDYTAASDFGRSIATIEALLGQIYLVTVVAVLVGRMTVIHRGSERPDATAPVEDAAPAPAPRD